VGESVPLSELEPGEVGIVTGLPPAGSYPGLSVNAGDVAVMATGNVAVFPRLKRHTAFADRYRVRRLDPGETVTLARSES
jgi:hypothetical protein